MVRMSVFLTDLVLWCQTVREGRWRIRLGSRPVIRTLLLSALMLSFVTIDIVLVMRRTWSR